MSGLCTERAACRPARGTADPERVVRAEAVRPTTRPLEVSGCKGRARAKSFIPTGGWPTDGAEGVARHGHDGFSRAAMRLTENRVSVPVAGGAVMQGPDLHAQRGRMRSSGTKAQPGLARRSARSTHRPWRNRYGHDDGVATAAVWPATGPCLRVRYGAPAYHRNRRWRATVITALGGAHRAPVAPGSGARAALANWQPPRVPLSPPAKKCGPTAGEVGPQGWSGKPGVQASAPT